MTSLLATCCDGPIKPVEDICRDIFKLEELVKSVGIIHDHCSITNCSILVSDIPVIRKIPFARLLAEAYLNTESKSVSSLTQLSENK